MLYSFPDTTREDVFLGSLSFWNYLKGKIQVPFPEKAKHFSFAYSGILK